MTRRWTLVLAMVGAVMLAACGDDDGDADTGPGTDTGGATRDPTFTNVYTTVISRSCSCHLTPAGAGGLVMDTQAAAFGNLVGTEAQVGGMCSGQRVAAGAPSDSVLYRKVSGENLCGARMPRGSPPLPNADIDLIQRWIAAGAPND